MRRDDDDDCIEWYCRWLFILFVSALRIVLWQCKFVLRLERREKKKYLILIVFHPSNRSEIFVHGLAAASSRVHRIGRLVLCIEVIGKSFERSF
jgi:hypothetical protein